MPLPLPLPHALSGKPFTIKQAKAAGLTRRRARAQDLQSPCHGVRIPKTLQPISKKAAQQPS